MKQREKHGPLEKDNLNDTEYIGIGASGSISVPSRECFLVLLPYALHITVDHTVKICSQKTVYPLESGISARIITITLGTSPYYPQNKENEMK